MATGSSGMANSQISKAMRRVRNFLGVFAANENPLILIKSFPCCFIMNSEPLHTDGHWLAFYLLSPRRLEFFDSLGFPLSHYSLLARYFTHFTSSIHSSSVLQSTKSPLCGEYCIAFLHLRSIPHPLRFSHIISYLLHKNNSRDSFVSRFGLFK